MNKCQKIQVNFVEALQGELSAGEFQRVETHLAKCPQCAAEYEQIRSTLSRLSTYSRLDLGDDYWDCFMDRLEESIDSQPGRGRGLLERVREFVGGWTSPLQGTLRPALAGAALLLIGIVIGRTFLGTGNIEQQQTVITLQSAEQARGYARAASYFGRAKLVLLGLVNYDTETEEMLTVSLDRQVRLSRELVDEIPILRAELDPRSDAALLELISELETILLQTANLESDYGIVEIKLIQQGAQRKALLFKIDIGENILSRDDARARSVPGNSPDGKPGGSLL